jgi:hypothetical protein
LLALKEKISTFFSGSFSSFCFLLVEEETSGMFGLLGLGQNADPPSSSLNSQQPPQFSVVNTITYV